MISGLSCHSDYHQQTFINQNDDNYQNYYKSDSMKQRINCNQYRSGESEFDSCNQLCLQEGSSHSVALLKILFH